MTTEAKPKHLPRLLEILKYGDARLRKKAVPVTEIDDALRGKIQSMFRTMYEEPGVGLAAPQVGIPLRLMVIDVAPNGKSQPLVFINPKIEETKGRVGAEEGCLSFPGIYASIRRAEWVKVTALNENGLPMTVSGGGLLARCILHEIDHLDGVLMIDRMPLARRLKALWEIRRRKKAGTW